jgi:hypothetical protein
LRAGLGLLAEQRGVQGMSIKNVSELLNLINAGAPLKVKASHYAIDEFFTIANACANAGVALEIEGALYLRTADLLEIAKLGQGKVTICE